MFVIKFCMGLALYAIFAVRHSKSNPEETDHTSPAADDDTSDIAEEDPFPSGYNPDYRDAHTKRLTGRIAGGRLVQQFQIPHQLYIRNYKSKEFICGAVLVNISDIHVVLTAANCIWKGVPEKNSTISLETVEIVAGATTLTDHAVHEQYRGVKKASIFPNFDPDTYLNDIAILFIDPNFGETKAVRTATLPHIDFAAPYKVEISGWGSTTQGGNVSDALKFTQMESYSGPHCARLYKLELDDRHFCAKPRNGNGSCFGDFGGPVMATNVTADMVYLAGIMSRTISFQCGNSYKPTIFTRVAPYLRWIGKEATDFKNSLPPDDDDNDEVLGP